MDRETGGNRFIPGDAGHVAFVSAVERGIDDLTDWAINTGRRIDFGAITVSTKRIPSGLISVTVTGDLADIAPADACRHCGKSPEADGDHSCSCPHPDDFCPDHPRPEDPWNTCIIPPATTEEQR